MVRSRLVRVQHPAIRQEHGVVDRQLASAGRIDLAALRRGARHVYDVTLLLRSERVRKGWPTEMATLMTDVDARSQ